MNINGNMYGELGQVQNTPRSTSLGQGDFLRLMTEQLKNQDPLKPLESNEFLGQMAQFSTVQGIQGLQQSFEWMVAAIQDDQTLKGADMIGRDVLVPSDRFTLAENGMHGQVALPMGGTVTVEIKDKTTGEVVKVLSFVADSPGLKPFSWDGNLDDGEPAPQGEYTISARVGSGRSSEAVASLVSARVESVSLSSNGLILNLFGLGPVPISSVQQIG